MTIPMLNADDLLAVRQLTQQEQPLIHCITNHISINDCANAVLAIGAKPIMAEHPAEAAEITAMAQALAVNLGNINDARMTAMQHSGHAAHTKGIPIIIDLVGVGCSTLRRTFAKRFIQECRPQVLKGNISELKAIAGAAHHAQGIDAGAADAQTDTDSLAANCRILQSLAQATHSIVVATGIVDIITDGRQTYYIKNGCAMLSQITGTGCMLNVLIASFMAVGQPLTAAVLGTAFMGICGETAATTQGNGQFRTRLLDAFSTLPDEHFRRLLRCSRL